MRVNQIIGMATLLSSMVESADPFRDKATNNGEITGGIPNNPKKVVPKGLKEFNIRGNKIYAINYKNALKKAKL